MKLMYILPLLLIASLCYSYPIDGYKYTGIDRLAYQYKVYRDSNLVSRLKDGSFLMMDDIRLNLLGVGSNWPSQDEKMQREIDGIFRYLEPQYSLSIMDVTDPNNVKYAGRKENVGYQPGSVGKIAAAIALFAELGKIYGDDWEAIRALLYTKEVKGNEFVVSDHHTVPLYDIKKDKYTNRIVLQSDVFSLYEWLDHMFSKSSNAAASVIMREVILLHAMDTHYECASLEEMEELFEITDRRVLAGLSEDLINCPLRDLGIDEDEWKLGGFFTPGAERYVPRQGGSIGSTKGLMKYMHAMERGKVINERSSLELKRMMYMTDRRIRYAGARAIAGDAVYFKSGSLYSFKDEPGFVKRKYAGNRYNYMNSIAIVEKKDSTRRKYMVALMSNVLRKNSVAEHYGLATQMDKLIAKLGEDK
ncbi:MAG: hypothetical protein ACJA1A_002795 [Saprospiraceae bacterium]|jgi:hypothetical protein